MAVDETMEELAVAILLHFPVYSKAIFLPVSQIRMHTRISFRLENRIFFFFFVDR